MNQQNKIYIGNLHYGATPEELKESFERFGEIDDVHLVKDRDTGRSKGFAFITFNQAGSAQEALELNGTTLGGRQIKVSLAKESRTRGGSGSGGGGRSGGGFSGGRGGNGGGGGARRW